MTDAPRTRPQAQPAAECSQECGREDCRHGDHAPSREGRRRCEEKSVDHVRRTRDPKASDVDRHRHDERATDPTMHAPYAVNRQSRQVSADQHGLNEQEAQCDNACKAGCDVDRMAPCEQRARRRSGDRHSNGGRKSCPYQGHPDPFHPHRTQHDQTGLRTKCASRLVTFALGITGRRKTVS